MNKENWNLELSTYIKEGNLSEIEKSADYVTMIENGKVVFNEDIDNIKGTTLEELFIKEGGDYE